MKKSNCSELGERTLQEPTTFEQRIETTRLPRLEQAGQGHAGLAALLAAGAPADLAADDQGTQAALGQVVVGRHARLAHKDEQLVLMAQQPFRQRLAGMAFGLGKLFAQGAHQQHQFCVGALALDALGQPGLCQQVDLFDRLRPDHDFP